MRLLIYFIFIFVHLGFGSDTTLDFPLPEGDDDLDTEDIPSEILSLASATTTTTTIIIDSFVEDIVNNVTEPITTMTTTIPDEKPVKQFFTEYPLNVNLSSTKLSSITFNSYSNDTILLHTGDHDVLLINKNTGNIENSFKYANIIPVNHQTKRSNWLVFFDDNTQELSILNSTHTQTSTISFKPKQIHVFSAIDNLWVAETSDDLALYISQNSGAEWIKIEDSGSSTVVGWSSKANSVVIHQHARYIKLLDVLTYQINPILTDVSSAKLFSHYLFAERSNLNQSVLISHVNNLADKKFQPLPKRLQSQGSFYCAIEDINTQDLLLVFTTDNKLGENNETIPSICNLISYSKQNLFSLSNIDCRLFNNDNLLNTIECSKEELALYQVHGLSKSVYIANTASGPVTVISFDGGITWNKTHYECDKMVACPNNTSIVISSLTSSNDAPGIIVGKATDGLNEYVAVSSNGGRLWRLRSKGDGYLTAISNPNALIVDVSNNNQQSLNHSYRYSTDYGHHWHEGTFLNGTSFTVLSLIADRNNFFYALTLNNENLLNLIQLDFNHRIVAQCARHHLKEWSLHGVCINGSKLYYKRRISGSHCLDNVSAARTEPCACVLTDFGCSPGYRRSKDGICLPRSQYIFSQDCTCEANNTLLTKRRGYLKSENSQCTNGIENYLSDASATRRDPNQPNLFLYGVDSRTKRAIVEIHTNGFNQNDEDDDDDDDDVVEDSKPNTIWLVDQKYEITALVFDESAKQIYMGVEHDQLASIYRSGKNFRQENHQTERLTFDPNNELYKSRDERIEYLTIDWLTQNLYVLVRNKKTLQQSVFMLNIRTQKRRTIIKNQQIQPSILTVDPVKADLYWISHNSPSTFNIGNLQGQIKKQIQLLPTDANVSYMSYDPVTHEIIYVINSNIYGLNTLDHHRLSTRTIYEHSSIIQNALFVHPILYFTTENNDTNSSRISFHAIDILAKSFAKNIATIKDFDSLKLFIDIAPLMLTSATTINRCVSNPCSDICIPLEYGRFRCLCSDDARYQSCSCPIDERLAMGSCQSKNGQCASGRVLCQNRLNCAESAHICEQDHTQYTEAFKNTARCTLDKPNDGFDCYYSTNGDNNTCIPFEWLCDGAYDCPLGNDEEHCNKFTTTRTPATKVPSRCLTDQKFTHALCNNQCLKINTICRNVSNAFRCPEQFHLNCKQTHDKDQYVCKCYDNNHRCVTMIEQCDDYEHCEKVCQDSIHYATSETNKFFKASSTIWFILIVAVLIILAILILFFILHNRRRGKKAPVPTRTPTTNAETTVADSPPSDAHEKLLNNATTTANETS